MPFLVIVLLTILFTQGAFAAPSKSQRSLLYQHQRSTFLCDRPFSLEGQINTVDTVQWMPIVPLKRLATHFACYRHKCVNKKGKVQQGLVCCRQDPVFQQLEHDLHNWVPETRLLKKQCERYRFAEFLHEEKSGCQIFIDKKNKLIDPPPNKRGIIARTYLYMKDAYALRLSDAEVQLYMKWHREYPVSEVERERNERIFQIQGTRNRWV
ncbi:MAG: endonuclease [Candidatus Berkiella sp.]